jgi:cold shock CspA family protein
MRRQGRIVEWNDARGFGFVLWHGGDERAFAHISAFADRRARPAVGDVVTYDVTTDP